MDRLDSFGSNYSEEIAKIIDSHDKDLQQPSSIQFPEMNSQIQLINTNHLSPMINNNSIMRKHTKEYALSWINLTYEPKLPFSCTRKVILKKISGNVNFGTITGLMGPSGCGKSKLLGCINGQILSGLSYDTEIYISKSRRIRSCLIVQDQTEHLMMSLTTKESLLYASKIKNISVNETQMNHSNGSSTGSLGFASSTTSINEISPFINHEENVNRVILDLHLNDCADTLIGNCSGGQQKRIVIGLEMVTIEKPNIMCIDEPTSGLDSNAAEQVIECLKNITRKHSIGIVTSIHQPNSDVLMMFDQLYVLSKTGQCIYNNSPLELRNFLNQNEIPITELQIPIEILLKVASRIKTQSPLEDHLSNNGSTEETKKLADVIEQSVTNSILNISIKYGKFAGVNGIRTPPKCFSLKHLWYLIMRNIKSNIIREWKTLLFLLVFQWFSAVSIGFIFGKIGTDDGCIPFDPSVDRNMTCMDGRGAIQMEQMTIQNLKFQFFSLILYNFLQICYIVLTFPLEVKIFFNEQHNGWYSSGSYYWSKTIIDFLIDLIIAFIYNWICFIMTDQIGMNQWYNAIVNVNPRFAIHVMANILCSINNQGMAYVFSITNAHNLKICLCLTIIGLLVNCLFSGFFVPVFQLPKTLQLFADCSSLKLAFEVQLHAIYGMNRCDPSKQKWSMILYQLNLLEVDIWWNVKLLVIQAIVLRMLALYALIYTANNGISCNSFNCCMSNSNNDNIDMEVLIDNDKSLNRISPLP